MNVRERITTSNRTNLIIGIILIVAIIAIIILSIQAFFKVNSDEDTINLLQQQLATVKTDLTAAKTQLAALSSQFDDAEGHIASSDYEQDADIDILQEGLTTANKELSSINSQISGILSQVSGLQAKDISDDSQISSIMAQLSSVSNTTASIQTSITSLERTVATLSSIVSGLNYPLTNPAILFTSKSISQVAGSQTLVYTFTPAFSGYVYITGNSSSSAVYIRITDNSTSGTQVYAFGTGKTLTIPLSAGHNYSILFGNSAASGTVTAVLTGTYYY
jgi:uncharacterized coiled-coil protein SlyX